MPLHSQWGSQMAPAVNNPTADAGNPGGVGSIPGLGRAPGGGNGNLLQYSCLKKSNGERSLAGYSLWDL